MSDPSRILVVVDANFEVANALADAAAEVGWEPFLAGGAEAALGILPRLQGEVLLLVDLVSPVSGGLQLVLALRPRGGEEAPPPRRRCRAHPGADGRRRSSGEPLLVLVLP